MYRYYIEFYDDEENRTFYEAGIINATDFGTAAVKVEEAYTSPHETVIQLRLFEIEELLADWELKDFLKEDIKTTLSFSE